LLPADRGVQQRDLRRQRSHLILDYGVEDDDQIDVGGRPDPALGAAPVECHRNQVRPESRAGRFYKAFESLRKLPPVGSLS